MMIDTWLLGLIGILALTALLGMVRLQRAQQRHERAVQVKLAMLARAVESLRATSDLLNGGLTADEIRSLKKIKRRQRARLHRPTASPLILDPNPEGIRKDEAV